MTVLAQTIKYVNLSGEAVDKSAKRKVARNPRKREIEKFSICLQKAMIWSLQRFSRRVARSTLYPGFSLVRDSAQKCSVRLRDR
jgi:hypothetical protein